jgi:hypothetical protein
MREEDGGAVAPFSSYRRGPNFKTVVGRDYWIAAV